MKLGMEVGLGPDHTVLYGDPVPPLPKGAQPPIISPCLLWPKTAGWIKMPLDTEVDLSPGNIVLDGDPASPPLKKPLLTFWSMYCGQTPGEIKMPLGMEVGL